MKKLILFLLTALLLAGCRSEPGGATVKTEPVTETAQATEPAPSLVEQGIPWDESGTLLRLPLDVPDLWQYSGAAAFGNDLLLWGMDTHREESNTLLLCLVDLDSGTMLARTEIGCDSYITPQILGGSVYLCDSAAGQVFRLDGALQLREQWQAEPDGGTWYMGENETLYRLEDFSRLTATDLATGGRRTLLESSAEIYTNGSSASGLLFQYTDSETLEQRHVCLDLTDGTLRYPPYEDSFLSAARAGDTWLCSLQRDPNVYYLGSDAAPLRIRAEDSYLTLLEDGSILCTPYDSLSLTLYGPGGEFVSRCDLSDSGEYYMSGSLIPSQTGGWFFLLDSYNSSRFLMYWDTARGGTGEALPLEPIPPESEQMRLLRQEAEALEERYGVEILLGDRCQTEFSDFTAELTEDYEEILTELGELETALSAYPEGFFRQLRYYDVQGVQIQLVGALHPSEGSSREEGSYAAFTYPGMSRFVVVSDIFSTDVSSYYHEFSHNIDLFLEYQAGIAGNTGYSEEQWQALNPADFTYSYDYMSEFDILPEEYGNYFVDSYSIISPTEDRAQILENAMLGNNGWIFDNCPGIREKLAYYCGCIRASFDTEGWPETALWEQYLNG